METLSKSFANAHGTRLKIAFAKSLVEILHPIGKVWLLYLYIVPETESVWFRQLKRKLTTPDGRKLSNLYILKRAKCSQNLAISVSRIHW